MYVEIEVRELFGCFSDRYINKEESCVEFRFDRVDCQIETIDGLQELATSVVIFDGHCIHSDVGQFRCFVKYLLHFFVDFLTWKWFNGPSSGAGWLKPMRDRVDNVVSADCNHCLSPWSVYFI